MITVFTILISGVAIASPFLQREQYSLVDLLILGSAVGLSLLGIAGYLVLLSVGFSVLTLYIIMVCITAFVSFIVYKKQGMVWKLDTPKIKSQYLVPVVLAFVISLFGLLLRLRSVLHSPVISTLDPWLWLYNARYLQHTGTIDYTSLKAYPAGFVFLIVSLADFGTNYDSVYSLMRFFPPIISFFTIMVVYVVSRRYFGNEYAPVIISMAFAVGNLLQFRGRLATPETLAIFLFIVFLSYLYIYDGKSPYLTSLLLAGIVIYHPTTALIAFGIFFLNNIKFQQIPSIKKSIQIGMKYILPLVIFCIPAIISIALNNDIFARYGFYGNPVETTTVVDPIDSIDSSLKLMIGYSLGPVLFGLSLVGVLQFIVGIHDKKWTVTAWTVCVLWAASEFVPIIFFVYSAPRSATFIVFPASILMAQVVVTLIDNIRQDDSRLPKIPHKSKILKASIITVIISFQLVYGISYLYINSRTISSEEMQILDWIRENQDDDKIVFTYERWIGSYAIVYPKQCIANETLREGNLENLKSYLLSFNSDILIIVKQHESLYQELFEEGYQHLVNISRIHVFLLN